MVYNGQLGAAHPFMVGLAVETAIHYYDMTVMEGHPDYRVPPVVKRALDALWRDYYAPATHTLRYTRWDVPAIENWNVLNNLVAPGYAWYWNLTGDAASLSRGDDLFQHEFDQPEEFNLSGKQFSQIYKWSFDYVRWRSGIESSTVMPENNPFGGPYPDTEPPIETQVATPTITDTTATITWTTYENADSQIVYGTASGYYPLQSALQDSGQGVMSHSVTLTGLTPGATYHYRINSRDAAGNLASLGDAKFTTAAGGGGTLTGPGDQSGGTLAPDNDPGSAGSDASLASGTSAGTDTSLASGTTAGSGASLGTGSSSGTGSQSSSNAASPKQMLMQ